MPGALPGRVQQLLPAGGPLGEAGPPVGAEGLAEGTCTSWDRVLRKPPRS